MSRARDGRGRKQETHDYEGQHAGMPSYDAFGGFQASRADVRPDFVAGPLHIKYGPGVLGCAGPRAGQTALSGVHPNGGRWEEEVGPGRRQMQSARRANSFSRPAFNRSDSDPAGSVPGR